jgi:hypothetical protein
MGDDRTPNRAERRRRSTGVSVAAMSTANRAVLIHHSGTIPQGTLEDEALFARRVMKAAREAEAKQRRAARKAQRRARKASR